jgi:KaiC/GvpD/RAD55 family RecA-like ATPase
MSETIPAAAGARQAGARAQNPPEDISFSDNRKKKRSTGIVGLNLLLDGGFPKGALIMVYGSPVAGIDIAARQFWRADEDGGGTYLMNDGDPEVGMVNVGDVHPSMYQDWLLGDRMVIDSLSAMVIKYGIDGTLAFLRQARDEIRKTDANIMFLVYTGVHLPMDMTRLMRISDIVIEFSSEVHQAEIERTLAVQKIRKAAAPQRLLPFIITDNGIEASTTSRVV